MRNKQPEKTEKRKGSSGKPFFLLLLVAVIAAVILLLIIGMQQSVNSSVYSERQELLGRLTESSAAVVNDSLTYGQSITDILTDNAIQMLRSDPEETGDGSLSPSADLDTYIEEVRTWDGYDDLLFFFVDSNGKYYSSDGVYGKITNLNYYTATSEDKLSYIAALPHMDQETSYLIFRNRLSEELSVMTTQGETRLIYCGILYDIESLNNIVSQSFAGTNNTFIYDDSTGVMLYEYFGIKMLIDGYKIYPKFSQSEIVYGEDPEELIQACQNNETVVTALKIDGEEYYFCSAPIAPQNWSVAFIVQSRYLDNVSGNTFGKIILYITMIAIVLGAAVVFLIAVFYRNALSQKALREITVLNRDLELATRAKSDFLSNMSHDIRTPINGIMGMTTIAKGVEGNPEKTRQCLDRIDGASRHLLSLINDVLDMSRIERGKTEISAKPMDIRELIDNCCSIIHGQMNGRELTLLPRIDCEHPHLIGDELHLRQILINILGNAVKFTKDGGTIRFRCTETESTETTAVLAFEIEDTGIGMKPEFLATIFQPFTQEDNGSRTEYKGTGLGMAITKQLTDRMGGDIKVSSALNRGSCFTVTIPFAINPMAPTDEHPRTPDSPEPELPSHLQGIRILLAEDNELNMDIATELLSEAGAIITPAVDGSQALRLFRENRPGTFDAILMDVMMPNLNGLEATKIIRAMTRKDAATIPIIAMTANAFESDVQAVLDAGMNAHLAKPMNIDEVIRTVAFYTKKRDKENQE